MVTVFLDKEVSSQKAYFGSYFMSLFMPFIFIIMFKSIKLMKKDKLIINEQGIEFGGVDKYSKIDFNNLEKVVILSKEDCFFHTKKGYELNNNQVKLVVWHYKIKPKEFFTPIAQAANQFGFFIEDKKGVLNEKL